MNRTNDSSIDIAALTAQGARENNEDAFRVVETAKATMVLVADGLGGYEGGERASKAVCDVMESCFLAYPEVEEANVRRMIVAAHDAVCDLQKNGGSMKSTLCALLWSDTQRILAHVGDTRGYLFSKADIVHMTSDHSVAMQAVRMQELKMSALRKSPDRNKLLRTMGGDSVRADLFTWTSDEPVDRALLCTDGFWENVLEKEMCRTAKKSGNAREWLANMEHILCRKKDPSQDNYTAVAVVAKVSGT